MILIQIRINGSRDGGNQVNVKYILGLELIVFFDRFNVYYGENRKN